MRAALAAARLRHTVRRTVISCGYRLSAEVKDMNEKNIFDGYFGLERETLRVDINGRLAQSPHPFGDNEHITRDFCENQIEIVTPVCRSVTQALETLGELDDEVRRTLD